MTGHGRDFGLDPMDRTFVSAELGQLACERFYLQAVYAGRDHAAIVADLRLSSAGR